MDVLKVAWTATAIKQRNYIFAYWNERNKSNNFSRKLNQKFIERVSLLKTNPELGKKTSFKTNRVLTLGHFSIFYRLIDNTIFITSVWDNRQNPKKLRDFVKGNF